VATGADTWPGAMGYTQLAVQLVPGQEHAIEDCARIKRALR